MKFRKFLLPVMVAAIIFTACTAKDDNPTPDPSPLPSESILNVDTTGKDTSVQGTIGDYFPIEQNAYYVYDRSDALVTSSTYNMYVEGNKVQRITDAGIYRVTEILEYANGELTVNYASDSVSCFEKVLDAEMGYRMVILKEPLVIGNTWETYSGPTVRGVAKGKCAITDVNVEVETPNNGTVLAIEVSTELDNGYTNVEYYAKGIGLVKTGYYIKGYETSNVVDGVTNVTEMKDVTTDTVINNFSSDADYEFAVTVFYPNENADDLDQDELKYTYSAELSKEKMFEELLKNPAGKENERVISPNTTINFINITRTISQSVETGKSTENTIVYVDLSQDFADDMNAGSGYETLLLEALEATFKGFFKAHEFVLSVDGSPYVSKH